MLIHDDNNKINKNNYNKEWKPKYKIKSFCSGANQEALLFVLTIVKTMMDTLLLKSLFLFTLFQK